MNDEQQQRRARCTARCVLGASPVSTAARRRRYAHGRMKTTSRRLSAVLEGTMSSSIGGAITATNNREQRAAALHVGAAPAAQEPVAAQSLSGGFTAEIDEARTLFDGAKRGGVTALGPGAASAELLAESSAVMATAAAAALGQPGSESLLQYGPVRGDGRYIRELSTFLTRHYGETVHAAHLTLTSGATAGCALVSSLFFTAGSNVFIEDPSYFLAVSMFKDFGM